MRPEICPICEKTNCTHDMREIMIVLRKKRKQTYFSCNCGAMYMKDEFSTCPTCGKKICPSCVRQDTGKHKGNYCWIPGRLKHGHWGNNNNKFGGGKR